MINLSYIFTIGILLIVFGILTGVGVFVYRDAPKNGMDRKLWTIVALLVPNFMGLIVYLIVRSNKGKEKCVKCGKEVEKDFKVCPHCLHDRTLRCPNCHKEVGEDWKICPYCSTNLKEN
ncbi:zinc ribbon domain-containing protein [Sporosalibacterium faouarense]|uniref:zinc ribbon domain-containing protein n=1 Tax=Sporosalibacterium faouarense TaxID=516123 RepID=UPI00141C263E|nr:zinc ribbon domain-containing protein [Sporosalibacterium faouarense]MTI47364.1 zinc ribbon domain-containing protein [Bacillota bacterium]